MRRVTFLALSLCLLASCAGFPDGGGAADAAPRRPRLDPVRATVVAGTATARLSTLTTLGRARVDMTGVGPVDLARHRASLRFDHAGPEVDRLEAVVVDGVAHVRVDGGSWRTLAAEQLPQADPLQVLGLVADVPPDRLRRLGTEQVGGVATTRYRAATGASSITLWLDARGRIRRARTEVVTEGLQSRCTLELTDFGRRVRIEVP